MQQTPETAFSEFSTLSGYNLFDPDDLNRWMDNMKNVAYSIGRHKKGDDLLDVEEYDTTRAKYLMLCRDIKGIDNYLMSHSNASSAVLPLDSEELGISFEGVNYLREQNGIEPVDFRSPTLQALRDWCGLKFDAFGKSLTPPKDAKSWYQLSAQSEVSGVWHQPSLDDSGVDGWAGIKFDTKTGCLEEVINTYGVALDIDGDSPYGLSPYVEELKREGVQTQSDRQKEQDIFLDAISAVERLDIDDSFGGFEPSPVF